MRQRGLRVVRGLAGGERSLLLGCWQQLWAGAVRAHEVMLEAQPDSRGAHDADGGVDWTIRAR